MNTLVVGLGNPILTDDGVGVKIAREVQKALQAKTGNQRPTKTTISEASVGGLRLMELMIGYDQVIIIDAIQHRNGTHPGTIHRLTLDDLRSISPTQHSASAHDTTLMTALELGREMGLPLPENITILAVEVENVTEFNEEPTPAVAAAIPRAAEMVLEELSRLTRLEQEGL
jgi:hydrogenase maturation protease